jgi:Mitochondrial genome maintenance MGM101
MTIQELAGEALIPLREKEPPLVTFTEERPDVLARFPGLSSQRFSKEQEAVLLQKIPAEDIDILPTGELYVSQVRYRRILNDTFGPGGWGLIPTGDFQQDGGTLCREHSMFAEGRFISSAIGEADFQPNNPRYSKATAAESLKSNALTRCCKDLLVASECWDKRFCEGWKRKNAVAVWCVGKAGDNAGKKKKLWRRRDADRFEYPWEEHGTPPPPPVDASPDPDAPTVDLRADVAGGGASAPTPVEITPLKPAEREPEAVSFGAADRLSPDEELAARAEEIFGEWPPPATPPPPPPVAEFKPKKDYPFLRELAREKIRVGRDAYYRVLGAAGFEHASEILNRPTKIEIFKALQALPAEEATP